MGNRDIFDGDALVFAEVTKMMTSKCGSEVGDDAIRETESVDDIFKELDYPLSSGQNKWFVFDPLGELFDGDIHVLETTWRWLEGPDHV